MPKRVLGNDPFSNDGGDAAASEPPAAGATAGRASKRPPSRAPSKAPGARASKSPPARAASGAPSKSPSAARASKRPAAPSAAPAARASKRPPARKTGAPPPAAAVAAGDDDADVVTPEFVVPRAPAMPTGVGAPAEKRAAAPRVEVREAAASDGGDGDESVAPADLPPDLGREEISPADDASGAADGTVEVEDQIREIEARLDKLLHNAGEREVLGRVADRLRARINPGGAASTPAARSSRPPEGASQLAAAPRDESGNVFDVARELLSSDYYLRQWGRVAMRDRSEEVDDFGLDPKYEARFRPFFDFLYERWWRVETHGIENVPSDGRVILCANHSGAVPYDGAMLATALRREHPARRELRWLAEDFIFHFPFLGAFMNRIGAVRACQENAERLLRKSTVVGVFPEGVKGISKLYRERYRLQRFGRGGHVKLAIRTRTPIVPVAVLGAEETHPLIAPTGALAKLLGLPYVPITPTFPLLGPLGLVPAPTKWKIFFLDPIPMDGYAPEAADDEVLVGRLNEKIRTIIQEELDRAVRARRSVFRG